MILFWSLIALMVLISLVFLLIPLYRKNFWTCLLLAIFIPTLAIVLYFKWGHSHHLAETYLQQQQMATVKKTMAEFKSPEQLINKMQTILKQRPNSTRGWFLLGRLYLSLGKYQEAVDAFAKAHSLEPKNTTITLQYAQALFFTDKPQAKEQAVQLAKQVLIAEPNSDVAINLLALDAYQKGQYQTAIDYWEQLLGRYNAESTEAKTLLEAIANAQKKIKK